MCARVRRRLVAGHSSERRTAALRTPPHARSTAANASASVAEVAGGRAARGRRQWAGGQGGGRGRTPKVVHTRRREWLKQSDGEIPPQGIVRRTKKGRQAPARHATNDGNTPLAVAKSDIPGKMHSRAHTRSPRAQQDHETNKNPKKKNAAPFPPAGRRQGTRSQQVMPSRRQHVGRTIAGADQRAGRRPAIQFCAGDGGHSVKTVGARQ